MFTKIHWGRYHGPPFRSEESKMYRGLEFPKATQVRGCTVNPNLEYLPTEFVFHPYPKKFTIQCKEWIAKNLMLSNRCFIK